MVATGASGRLIFESADPVRPYGSERTKLQIANRRENLRSQAGHLTLNPSQTEFWRSTAFLYANERLLQSELGDPGFRLPVWNWENSGAVPDVYFQLPSLAGMPCQCLPRQHKIDVVERKALQSWLVSTTFDDFVACRANPGDPHLAPHEMASGYMKDIAVAAADPLFFAHHANIDRYWCYWWNYYKNIFTAHWDDTYMYFVDVHGRECPG